jgi:hypothetical protein
MTACPLKKHFKPLPEFSGRRAIETGLLDNHCHGHSAAPGGRNGALMSRLSDYHLLLAGRRLLKANGLEKVKILKYRAQYHAKERTTLSITQSKGVCGDDHATFSALKAEVESALSAPFNPPARGVICEAVDLALLSSGPGGGLAGHFLPGGLVSTTPGVDLG